MWRSLKDPNLIPAYESGFPAGSVPVALSRLLRSLSTQDFPREVFAVLSLWQLRLTTAPDYTVGEQHDAIFVGVHAEGFVVSYLAARRRGMDPSTRCKEEELYRVVERYLLRLLLHDS